MPIQPSFFVNSASIPAQINQSLRFDGGAYLSRSVGSAGNRKTWTYSTWVKRSILSGNQNLLRVSGTDNFTHLDVWFDNSNVLNIAGTSGYFKVTTQVFRDPSAWGHFVLVFDTTNGTAADRLRVYWNGQRIENFSSSTDLSYDTEYAVNRTAVHEVGKGYGYFSGYMAEVNFIDGFALDPTKFGTFDSNNVWRPIVYQGPYGTNGFHLDFSNSSNLGEDQAGSNNWTPGGFTTSGSGSDIFTDTPTTNESLFNFNQIRWGNGYSLSWGQNAWREFYGGSNGMGWGHFQTINGNSSGKYCWASASYTEYIGSCLHGVGKYPNSTNTSNGANKPYPRIQLQTNGNFSHGGLTTTPSYSNPVASSQSSNPGYFYCWFAWDIDAGKLWVRSSSTDSFPGWNGDPAAGTGAQVTNLYPNPGEDWGHFIYQTALGGSFYGYSFSGNHFSNFVPDGFTYLNSSAAGTLAITDPGKHFKTVTYTGTSAEQSITDVGFQPDLVWVKRRDSANSHALFDVVRGAGQRISSNESTAEIDNTANFTSFDSDGFSVASNGGETNLSGATYVAWCWKAGGTGTTNTDGSITSTVSANPTAGFSIVTYTGNNTTTPSTMPTVGHGLGVAPSLVISKSKNNAGIESGNWFVWHSAAGTGNWLRLNTTDAAASISTSGGGTMVAPTSTVFSTPYISGSNINGNNYVAYCFASVEGYSKFGSYIGNGLTDGPYVYCGFKPALVMVKRTDTNGYDWEIFDSARGTYNVIGPRLWANLNALETSATRIDFLSNGFKIRDSGGQVNGGTIFFAAFAESPSGGNNVSPATAR